MFFLVGCSIMANTPRSESRLAQREPPNRTARPRKTQDMCDPRLPYEIPEDAILIDIHQVAQILGVSVSTVRLWRDEGRLPPTVPAAKRKLLWRLSDIIEFSRSLG